MLPGQSEGADAARSVRGELMLPGQSEGADGARSVRGG